MKAYFKKVHELLGQFETAIITEVPRSKNSNTKTLAWLATNLKDNLLKTIPVEVLGTPSIDKTEVVA